MTRALRSWRWLVVLVGIAILVALPSVVGAWPVRVAAVDPAALAAKALASAETPYTGYVETRGGLALPDLPGLVDQVELFGETSHVRVWLRDRKTWRVDLLSPVGERDMFSADDGMWLWDSNRRRAQRIQVPGPLRLPWPFDLLPPELGRRLLAAASPGELRAIAPARVSGRSVPGVRIVPADPSTTVDHVDVWVEASTGLPVRVAVTPRTSSHPRLTSQFLELSLGAPDPTTVAFTPPARARVRHSTAVDPLAEAGLASPISLPVELAGLARGVRAAPNVATYGTRFHVVVVVALPGSLAGEFVPDAIPWSARPWGGQARLIETSLVNTMAFSVHGVGYVVSGPVVVGELDRIAAALQAGVT